jgi:2-aminobenzoate-CoA ligase
MSYTAHIDTFARDNLPPREQWPELRFDLPELRYPERLNCATVLLTDAVANGRGERTAILAPGGPRWTYADLLAQSNRIAQVLVEELGVVPGNRVLLRAPNTPLLAACLFAVMKAGAIAVGTMPQLRARELTNIATKAEVSHALCDRRLAAELEAARPKCPTLRTLAWFNTDAADGVEALAAAKAATFDDVSTASEDTALIAFTSGTTGKPKGTMHFHRDLLAACDCWPRHMLHATPDDVFTGSPPLAFTFGLGGLLLFPMRIGAATLLLERPSPDFLLPAVAELGATVLFTAPTGYRALSGPAAALDLKGLRKCVSAGEALPAATRAAWKAATGIEIIDGIGTTEMLHIFISHDEAHARPGAMGQVVPGYTACVMDDDGRPVPPGTVGRLAVKGPTGCRYLADERQTQYVRDGWNYTGDACELDHDGYFIYQARTDDLIVSAGYNIAGPEVEAALLLHPAVADCGVIGAPDEERGQLVTAYVVLKPGHAPDEATTRALQSFVKETIAPYKYPRAIEYLDRLPRTENGKLQRFRLRALAAGRALP